MAKAPTHSWETLFRRIRRLDETRELWWVRSICTSDLSEGLATYLERITIDLDVSYLEEHDGYFYLPIAWRIRASFLELDCKTNNGDSMQLVPLAFRRKYMSWEFWQVCREVGLISPGERVCSCLKEHVDNIILSPEAGDLNALPSCPFHHRDCCDKWRKIQDSPALSNYIYKLLKSEPLILKVRAEKLCESPQGPDISIIKISERKPIVAPKASWYETLKGEMWGVIEPFWAGTNKLVVPRDMRIVGGYLYIPSDGVQGKLRAKEVQIEGDGSWLHVREKNTYGRSFLIVGFRPRRPFLFKPGLTILILSFIAAISWLVLFKDSFWPNCKGFLVSSCDLGAVQNKEILKATMSAMPFGLLFAYFLTRIPIFYHVSERSFLYYVWTQRHYRLLGFTMAATTAFPFLHSIVPLQLSLDLYFARPMLADVAHIFIIFLQVVLIASFSVLVHKKRANSHTGRPVRRAKVA